MWIIVTYVDNSLYPDLKTFHDPKKILEGDYTSENYDTVLQTCLLNLNDTTNILESRITKYEHKKKKDNRISYVAGATSIGVTVVGVTVVAAFPPSLVVAGLICSGTSIGAGVASLTARLYAWYHGNKAKESQELLDNVQEKTETIHLKIKEHGANNYAEIRKPYFESTVSDVKELRKKAEKLSNKKRSKRVKKKP